MPNEISRFIQEENYDGLMDWAYSHDDPSSSEDTLKSVADAYEYLIGKGYGIAANNLGSMYYCGRYFSEDVDEAIRYYEIACDMGVQMAWGNLGCCYYYGIRKDYKKAYEVFAEGAFLFNDVECLYMLGDMFHYGRYVKKHPDKALHLYLKALNSINPEDKRDCSLNGDAMYRLGGFLIEDENNVTEGIKLLYQALGNLYTVIKDDKFALQKIEKVKEMIKKAEEKFSVENTSYYA